jgi:geranylgeranyl pyrophosphate synthase
MLLGIRKKIDAELNNFLSRLRKRHSLHKISPLLYQSIKEFVLRRGKRIRPTLFIIGYLGFSQEPLCS